MGRSAQRTRDKILGSAWRSARSATSLPSREILLGGRLSIWRSFGVCRHSRTITTITAGLARVVCETCGHISVRYVENSVQVYPTLERRYVPRPEPSPRPADGTSGTSRGCLHCAQQAVYLIPDGMVCDEHAWQAAARIRWDESAIWVPIRIDRSNA